ncbi:Uncharacterised protein [Streptococcus pneumoniae]|nr:Uncharacterised protein [Streptococcus pneumoniae]
MDPARGAGGRRARLAGRARRAVPGLAGARGGPQRPDHRGRGLRAVPRAGLAGAPRPGEARRRADGPARRGPHPRARPGLRLRGSGPRRVARRGGGAGAAAGRRGGTDRAGGRPAGRRRPRPAGGGADRRTVVPDPA